MSVNLFDFSDIQVIEIPVIGPDGEKYILREANGHAAKEFNDARLSGLSFGPDGKMSKMTGMGGLESLLVSLCLTAENGRPIQRAAIEKWPARVVSKLFEKAKEISGLDAEKDPVRDSLEFVLNQKDSPMTYKDFAEYVRSIPSKEADPLKKMFKVPLGN